MNWPGVLTRGAVSGLFILLAVLFVLLRGHVHLPADDGLYSLPFESWGNACGGELRPCLRIGGAVVGQGLNALARLAAEPLFWGLERAAGAHTPWPIPDTTRRMGAALLPLVVHLAYGVLCLTPILVAARCLFTRTPVRLAFIMAAFGALFGWHPALVTAFFDAASLTADWPRSYYLFDVFVLFYDLMSVGLALAAVLVAAHDRLRPAWVALALAAFGQATLEHMGFVVGLIIAVGALAHGWRSALTRLVAAGIGSVAVATLVVVAYYALGQRTEVDAAGGGALMTRYLPTNLAWLKVILANILTMAALGFAGGAAAGLLAGLLGDGDRAVLRRVALASVGGMGAFVVVMAAGLPFLAYPAEMGRQFLPLSALAAFAGCALTQMAALKLRHR